MYVLASVEVLCEGDDFIGVEVPDGVGVDDVAIGVVAPDAEADGILI